MRIKSNTYAGNISKRGKVKPSLVITMKIEINLFVLFCGFREKPTLLPILLAQFFWVSLFSLSLAQVISFN